MLSPSFRADVRTESHNYVSKESTRICCSRCSEQQQLDLFEQDPTWIALLSPQQAPLMHRRRTATSPIDTCQPFKPLLDSKSPAGPLSFHGGTSRFRASSYRRTARYCLAAYSEKYVRFGHARHSRDNSLVFVVGTVESDSDWDDVLAMEAVGAGTHRLHYSSGRIQDSCNSVLSVTRTPGSAICVRR